MEMVHFIPPSHRRLAMLAAQADTAPVLISGASGTGKGAIAQWIHRNSPRSARAFLISERDRPLLEQLPLAQGGTLVVSEIGEWPLSEQRVLANFLKTRSIPHPSGDGTPMLLNVRIIATSSHSLEGRAQGGLFNIDLLERLNVFRIEMPPLSRRQSDCKEDFEDIVLGVLGELVREVHREHLRSLSDEAWNELRHYEWPGNIRELRNVLRLAVLAAKGDRIEFEDLPRFGHDRVDFRATREEFEKTYLAELLKTFDWDIDRTCRLARMDRQAVLEKVRKYGLSAPPATS